MSSCTVTTGFFVLRRCGGPAVTGCVQCGRPLCRQHVAEAGLCPECAAARGFGARPGASPWVAAAHHRRMFRTRSAGDYADQGWYSSLDSYDRSAFDPTMAGSPDYDPDDGDALVDS